MKKLKEFIKKKQLDNKFKKLGGGHQLGEPGARQEAGLAVGPSISGGGSTLPQNVHRPDVDVVAAAAEKRFQKMENKNDPYAGLTPMQKMVRIQARKELKEEHRRMAQQIGSLSTKNEERGGNLKQIEPKVFYTCEIFDEDVALPKSEMMNAIESALNEFLANAEADPINTSILMIYTLNREEVGKTAVETIQKYLQNIIEHPKETKYLQIRQSNRIFTEKIKTTKGAVEFLKAIGFLEKKVENETFMIMSSSTDSQTLVEALKLLKEGKPISIRVFRDPTVYIIDPDRAIPNPEIPLDFFKLTVDELKREQQQRTEAAEQIRMLKTQRMRETDLKKKEWENNTYKYSYIRIRFPNNYVLQGIFNVYEKYSAVREFVSQYLSFEHGTFTLSSARNSANQQQLEEQENNLLDYGLVPSALIHFCWESQTLAYFSEKGLTVSYLTSEMEAKAGQLN